MIFTGVSEPKRGEYAENKKEFPRKAFLYENMMKNKVVPHFLSAEKMLIYRDFRTENDRKTEYA